MTTTFDELLRLVGNRKLPPVELWEPSNVGEIDIRIDENGTWFHEGSEIKRFELVKLFSTVLRREADDYFLVTPAEKLKIVVEEVPFVAVDMDYKRDDAVQRVIFRTNVDDYVLLDDKHELVIKYRLNEPRPQLHIRNNLYALLTRSVYYRLVNDVAELDQEELIVESAGVRFSLARFEPRNS